MRVPLNWLKDYIPYEGDPKELGDRLTLSGTKLESLEVVGAGLTDLYVGQIVGLEPHPDADKLSVCQIDLGSLPLEEHGIPAGETAQIVCGAPNVALGQKVIVAVPGAQLPEFKIGARKLRGVQSYGMLCSLNELGFDESVLPPGAGDGIAILPEQAEVGCPVDPYLGLGEAVLDFELTSNRPDCLSIEGIAREAAATLGLPFEPSQPKVRAGNTWDQEPKTIHIDAPERCRVYLGRYIKDVKIEPSPLWMQNRLRDAGIRPINNLVDITNYVLIDIGQPLHAFDADYLEGNEIHVRYAEDNEKFTTLDGTERTLRGTDLVIADAHKAVALAGIMGGENSEIQPSTKTVFFEAANFTPVGIGRSSRRLNLRSESSSRFDKGLDPELPARALDLACALVEQLGAGKVCDEIYMDRGEERSCPEIPLEVDRINAYLGTDVTTEWVEDILERLGCKVEDGVVKTPSWRVDLESMADLAEEVARFYDYNKIPPTLPTIPGEVVGGLSERQQKINRLRDLCANYGAYEVMSYPFQREDTWEKLGLKPEDDDRVRLRDAGREYACLRDRMLPSMLKIASLNQRRGNEDFRFYEIANAYHRTHDAEGLPSEEPHLAVLALDPPEQHSGQSFYEFKGLVEEVQSLFGIDGAWDYQPIDLERHPYFHPYRAVELSFDGEALGVLGYLHPELLDELDIHVETCYLEILIDPILDRPSRLPQAELVSRYPSMERDIALVVKDEVPGGELLETLRQAAGEYLEEASLFDIYRGEALGQDEKSMAFHFVFTNAERTLKEAEVQEAMDRILKVAAERFNAKLRS